MESEATEEGLVVIRSRIPMLRAGYSNAILFVTALWLLLTNQVLNDAGANTWARAAALVAVALGGLKAYSCSLSRLYVEHGRTLVLVGPVSRSAIDLSDIVGFEVSGIAVSQFVSLKIRVRSSRWPRYRYFVAVLTNLGPHAETRTRLQEFMTDVLRPSATPRPSPS